MDEISKAEHQKKQTIKRADHELPYATRALGWRYHHLGVPTDREMPGEVYLEAYKMYVSGFDSSPFGVEWMRFEPDSPISEIIKTTPHLAFEVDDLAKAVEGRVLIGKISSPSAGVRVAMFLDNGAPIEVLEFDKRRHA